MTVCSTRQATAASPSCQKLPSTKEAEEGAFGGTASWLMAARLRMTKTLEDLGAAGIDHPPIISARGANNMPSRPCTLMQDNAQPVGASWRLKKGVVRLGSTNQKPVDQKPLDDDCVPYDDREKGEDVTRRKGCGAC